ncbi:MAG TPA: hypothetical protein PK007_01115, partial [Candidatus Kapabacteria bacterium]|nr:hypothetical protein [Candidatus Kapabacteria bacterium]
FNTRILLHLPHLFCVNKHNDLIYVDCKDEVIKGIPELLYDTEVGYFLQTGQSTPAFKRPAKT